MGGRRSLRFKNINILVGGFNPSETYKSVGMIIPNIWKFRKVPNHQAVYWLDDSRISNKHRWNMVGWSRWIDKDNEKADCMLGNYKPNRTTVNLELKKYHFEISNRIPLLGRVVGWINRYVDWGLNGIKLCVETRMVDLWLTKLPTEGLPLTGNSAQISVGPRKFHQWGGIRNGCMVNECDMYHHVPKYRSIKKNIQYDCDGHLMVPPQTKASINSFIPTTKHVPYPISANTRSLFLLSWGWTLPQIEDLILQCLLSGAILAMLAAGVMLGRQLGVPGGYGWE